MRLFLAVFLKNSPWPIKTIIRPNIVEGDRFDKLIQGCIKSGLVTRSDNRHHPLVHIILGTKLSIFRTRKIEKESRIKCTALL